MNSVYDVQQLLKKFGIFIYIGDRLADLEMMEAEIRELHAENLISKEDFQHSILLLRRERTKIQEDRHKNKK
ncbi:YqgQ family protein [Bacillus norwichensis]|uniref:YqgQ family protein n=1 Tax=Bacillus norwichensis TaxID=2762217 RepID=A0ABR8VFK1_9BACI|nr:YqgQ family protein [Bacillus norwichensis]MBD8003567.1 YqgQ family protein [Bacillus norwichensis]